MAATREARSEVWVGPCGRQLAGSQSEAREENGEVTKSWVLGGHRASVPPQRPPRPPPRGQTAWLCNTEDIVCTGQD